MDKMVDEQSKMLKQPTTKFNIMPTCAKPAPTAIATEPPKPPSPSQPYSSSGSQGPGQTNRCHIHVWEHQNCNTDALNLKAKIQMWDAAGQQILAKSDLKGINAGASGLWTSKLEDVMILTGEHKGDYIQFALGSQSWSSKDSDEKKDNWCNAPGSWSPKNGPSCGGLFDEKNGAESVRQMDCFFQCPYHGGKPSDRS
ncbi:hypothetical protein EJ08DRAFT_693309 [Tothia fuscella]|uniref:Uncharacterized protein n=1 Tax=Tothia fuscella TaxID=1048955 RepID=A0A9P4U3A6_9PEZI|nr:hypothetical protein EJ08DRAFT_693309 [Tothia fuscella]